MRDGGNDHESSWDAAYTYIKKQKGGLFKVSPKNAAAQITETVIREREKFSYCVEYLDNLHPNRKLIRDLEKENKRKEQEEKDREKKRKKLKKELEGNGTKVYLVKGDLSKEKDVNKIVKYAKLKLKYFDCLINNASLFENDKITSNSIKEIYGPVDGSAEEINEVAKYLSPLKSKILLREDAKEINLNKQIMCHPLPILSTISNANAGQIIVLSFSSNIIAPALPIVTTKYLALINSF